MDIDSGEELLFTTERAQLLPAAGMPLGNWVRGLSPRPLLHVLNHLAASY